MAGTIFTSIQHALAGFPPFQDFRRGRMPIGDYVAELERVEPTMQRWGLNRDQLHLSGRFPIDEEAYVDGILADLVASGAIAGSRYDKAAFTAFRTRVAREFDHGEFATYIFPEEERLVYALAEIVAPVSAGFFGSYYGYWAIWAMPALARSGGHGYLLDLDPRVNELAVRNFRRLGYGELVTAITQDAVGFLEQDGTTYDFALIDAEGPEHHADPDYCKKRIYYPIFRACLPRLRDHALVAVHNMLLTNLSSDRYFAERIGINRGQFDKLLPFLGQHFPIRREYPTSEGVGVYRR